MMLAVVSPRAAECDKPVYLSFDTGHMGVASLIAEILKRQQVRASFFLANESTLQGGSTLGPEWAAWWRARAQEGHVFGSHTYDHAYWAGDLGEDPQTHEQRFRVRPSAGEHAGVSAVWTATQYCANLEKAAQRFRDMTGQRMLPLFRAPGGKTSTALLNAARQCGWAHVGWSPAGFLGDELPSESFPNARLLNNALTHIRSGDILMAHLGIRSRHDPWAPSVLEPLIIGLKQRGFCFATMDQHPQYRDWLTQHPTQPAQP